MDKWQSQQAFWSSFGIPAYDEQSVTTEDDQTDWKYLTYEGISDTQFKPNSISVNVYDRSTSLAWLSQKVSEIEQALDGGGVKVRHDTGEVWFKIPTVTPSIHYCHSKY